MANFAGVRAMRKIRERYFFGFWAVLLAVLWVVRLACPGVVRGKDKGLEADVEEEEEVTVIGGEPYHRIKGVVSYARSFPDLQDVQLEAAQRYGVPPVKDRDEAELRKSELVYIGSSPYYDIDKRMNASIPYLVPRAARLLSDIGRNYLDSLASKGIPLHKVIVTSVLRTEADVRRLVRRNGNASDQSCHRFGTTFDICYNRYATVSPPGEQRRPVRNDTLKWVLSEVLRDLRETGRCYVKYEVRQGCFHITTR
ncbi:MAG: DUF5715 family protein [Prevotellaceae bacterium]|nr:DUF5715 family protein [Prevotellaceae bacterium]